MLNCAANNISGENLISVDWSQITLSLVDFEQIVRFFTDR